MSRNIILASFLMVLAYKTFAMDFEDAVFPELAVSSRALAMGNTYLAKSDDNYAAFYNPAGLGTVRKTQFHLGFHLETNRNWINNTTSADYGNFFKRATDSFNLEGTRKLLLERRNRLTFGRLHILPSFTTRYFTTGYLYAKRNKSIIENGPAALFEFAKRTDHGPYGAANLSLHGGIVKLGVMGILLNRKDIQGELPNDVPVALTGRQQRKGSALIMNYGGKITIPITFLPTVAVQYHNAHNKKFKASDGYFAPETIRRTFDAGISITPQIGRYNRVHIEANLRDIGKKYKNVSSTRKIGFGMEFDFLRTFFLRLGYGDGFGTFGIGLKTQSTNFDLTTYAVDTSASGLRGQEDRRLSLSFSYGF
ncbi:MAG: hypothetical protein OXB84_00660 [Halobacteriovoraceae bacterium]|nr:hypothetical protein [Halobacteriovoraceae bacterium]